MKKISDFKKGAASFYIVAIATLLLVIIATSFIAVIISEITRTSNNDLAQSAYDSALAGVEDAKLAYYNYQNCLKSGVGKATGLNGDGAVNCDEVRYLVESSDDCSMTAKIVGRNGESDESEVVVEEGDSGSNNMQQAYTCVIFKTDLQNYIVTLNSANPTRVLRPGDSLDEKISAESIKSVKISWQTEDDRAEEEVEGETGAAGTYAVLDGSGIFGDASLLPPVLSVGLIQTSKNFNMSSFDMTTSDGTTNRGTLYLVPSDNKGGVLDGKEDNTIRLSENDPYISAYNAGKGKNLIKNSLVVKNGDKVETKFGGFLKSNDKTARNLPYVVRCSEDDGYMCSVIIDLPSAVDGDRIKETFGIVLSLPYSDVGTDVKVEYFTEVGETVIDSDGGIEPTTQKGAQVEVDSTGRANELYRRVVTRLNVSNDAGQYPIYAIQLLGNNASEGDSLIDKNFWTTCEWDFGAHTCEPGV